MKTVAFIITVYECQGLAEYTLFVTATAINT